jgi:hypothetical protein
VWLYEWHCCIDRGESRRRGDHHNVYVARFW